LKDIRTSVSKLKNDQLSRKQYCFYMYCFFFLFLWNWKSAYEKGKEEWNDGVPILPNTTAKVTPYGWARSNQKMTDICCFYHRKLKATMMSLCDNLFYYKTHKLQNQTHFHQMTNKYNFLKFQTNHNMHKSYNKFIWKNAIKQVNTQTNYIYYIKMQKKKSIFWKWITTKKKGSFVTWCGEYSKNIEPE
jgi:hypothetical protein